MSAWHALYDRYYLSMYNKLLRNVGITAIGAGLLSLPGETSDILASAGMILTIARPFDELL